MTYIYSLFKDKGSGPENASSNCRARAFRYFLRMPGLNAKMILQDRVRQYFDKIKDAEDPAKRPCLVLYPIIHPLNYYRTPHTGQLVIDKAAATRFIKNAIAQANDTILTNASDSGPSTTTTTTTTAATRPHLGDDSGNGKNANDKAHDAHVPAKKTEKMLEREKYHKALWEEAQLASDEDGELLDIIDNDNGDEEEERDEGKANAAVASPIPIPDVPPPSMAASRKRRRPPIDPFAGSCGSHQFMFFFFLPPTITSPCHRLWRWSRHYPGPFLCSVR